MNYDKVNILCNHYGNQEIVYCLSPEAPILPLSYHHNFLFPPKKPQS